MSRPGGRAAVACAGGEIRRYVPVGIYEGAQRGFTMADTAAYQEAGEQRHWVNLFDLLDRTLPVPKR